MFYATNWTPSGSTQYMAATCDNSRVTLWTTLVNLHGVHTR